MTYIGTEYDDVWRELYRKREALLDRHTELETQIADVSNQLAHIKEIMVHLEPLAGLGSGENIINMGITDAVRWILKNAEGARMSPVEIRDQLLEKGYDMTTLTAPMSSIYKILSRLADQKRPEVTRENEGSNVFYRWIEIDPAIEALANAQGVV
jgi:hypothetical protein